MNIKNPLLIVSCCAALVGLSGCTPLGLVTGVAASTGVAAAQEGGLKRATTDLRIQASINDLWFQYSLEAFTKLDMTVNQGRVLLTGVVQNPEHRVEAVRLSWQVRGVKQVINEINVSEKVGVTTYARDAWISARLRMALTFDRDVQSINYSIDTVQGTVYLMGVAQSQSELNRVVETARTIKDVRRVVSYVKFAGEQDQAYQAPPAGEMPTQKASSAVKDSDTIVWNDSDPIKWNGVGADPNASANNTNSPVQIAPINQ